MLSARDAMLTDSRWDESARVYSNWYGHSWDDTLNPARKRWCMGRLSSECQEDEGSHVEFEDAMDETARLYKNSYGHSWGDTFDPVRKRWYRCSWDWPRWRYQAKHRKPPVGRDMWSRCSNQLHFVQRSLLRFDDEEVESQYLRHIAARGGWGCLLGCFVFFWPWTAWELGALLNESRGPDEGARLGIAHYSAAFSLTLAASSLTLVTWLSCMGRAQWLAEFLHQELLWELAVGSPPEHVCWVAALAVVVLCCLPVRCHISWLTLLAAILTSSIDERISWPNGTLLCGFLVCVCRLSWLEEKYHRYSWLRQLEEESNKPAPPALSLHYPFLTSWLDFEQDMSLKKSASVGRLRSQVHKTSSASDANVPGMVEGHLFSSATARDFSRECSMSQDCVGKVSDLSF
eukprot:s5238_g1.t1